MNSKVKNKIYFLQAVKDESIKMRDPNYEKKLAKEEYVNNIKDLKEKMTILGVPDDKLYTLDSISKIELKHGREKKNQKSAYFGWDGKIKYRNI